MNEIKIAVEDKNSGIADISAKYINPLAYKQRLKNKKVTILF